MLRGVNGDHRRGLAQTVAFHDRHADPVEEEPGLARERGSTGGAITDSTAETSAQYAVDEGVRERMLEREPWRDGLALQLQRGPPNGDVPPPERRHIAREPGCLRDVHRAVDQLLVETGHGEQQ